MRPVKPDFSNKDLGPGTVQGTEEPKLNQTDRSLPPGSCAGMGWGRRCQIFY